MIKMKSKTYYAQLKPIVTKFVKNFQTDFTTHDKRILRENKGSSFLYAIRESGTDLFPIELLDTRDKISNAKIWLTTYNQRFFYLLNGTVKEITKEETLEHFNDIERRLIPLNENSPIIKTVSYCDIRPESDSICWYKGIKYATRENLQYYPKKVRLC